LQLGSALLIAEPGGTGTFSVLVLSAIQTIDGAYVAFNVLL